MPELPEVEVSRLGITPHIANQTIKQLIVRNWALRWPVDPQLPRKLQNAKITHTSRRGKYLLFHCTLDSKLTGVLLIHLGMSGSLRIVSHDAPVQKHDHIDMLFPLCILRYHDPRRFGSVLWHDDRDGHYSQHPRLIGLGVEPFDQVFTTDHFFQQAKTKKSPIKTVLLTGEIVVGVGNIYASEVLFRCKIHPEEKTNELTQAQCQLLVENIKLVLQEAIENGGSTLKDFVNSDGASGYFQMHYNVYDRSEQPCKVCAEPIKRIIQAQRATYYCPSCQKMQREKT